MRKISVFNFITLNGYYKGPGEDISWHKQNQQAEEGKYASDMLKSDNILLFGRVTYEMMAGYWPTPMAKQNDAEVAEGMNNAEKIVFSKTLKNATWDNTRIISDNMIGEIKKLKQTAGKNMTLLGSGTILTQLANEGLIDEFKIMLDPVAIGEGTSIFKNIKHKLELKLTDTKSFKNGIVLLSYRI